MKSFTVGIFLCLIATFGVSQNPDSLVRAILATPNDTLKIKQLNDYAYSVRESNNDEALALAERAKGFAEKINYRKGLAPILENIGWIVYRKGNFAKALIYANQAIDIYTEFNDKRGIANCSNNISAILTEQKRYDESVKILRRAMSYASELRDYGVMARCAVNTALGFLPMGQLDSAQHYSELAITYGTKAADPYRVAFGKRTLGDIFLVKKDYANAQKSFFDALLPTEMGGNVFLEASTLYRIAKTYFLTGNYEKALFYLERNQSLSEKLGFKIELERTYQLLADIYRVKKDNAKIVFYQDLYLSVHDSLLIQRSNEQMALKLAKYESDIQQARIELLTKDTQLKEDEIKGHQLWNIVFVTSLIILALIGAILFYANQRISRVNVDLHDSNVKIHEQARQLRELNATKDKIFSIIGHDLRGPLASLRGLMGLLSSSNLTHEEFAVLSKKLKDNLDYVSDDLDNLLNWARSQASGIEPQLEWCNPHSMVQDLHQLYSESARTKNISLENRVPESIEIKADRNHMKLILRNLIGNSIKFSHKGGVVSAEGVVKDDKALVSIVDRGKGMSDDEMKNLFFIGTHFTKPGTNNEKGLGIGLLLVKEFVDKNSGTISVESKEGKGSTFTVCFDGQHRKS